MGTNSKMVWFILWGYPTLFRTHRAGRSWGVFLGVHGHFGYNQNIFFFEPCHCKTTHDSSCLQNVPFRKPSYVWFLTVSPQASERGFAAITATWRSFMLIQNGGFFERKIIRMDCYCSSWFQPWMSESLSHFSAYHPCNLWYVPTRRKKSPAPLICLACWDDPGWSASWWDRG